MTFTAEQLAQFRSAMVDTWNVPIHVEKYIVHEDAFTQTFQAVTDLLVDAIDPKPGQRILDIATGTGADVWDFFAGALQAPLTTLDDDTRKQLDAEVIAGLDARHDDGGISLPLRLHITVGTTSG